MGQPLIDDLASWHADWGGRRIAVLGLGERGFSVADTLRELGAEVLVVAEEASEEHRELLDVIGADLGILAGADAPDVVTAFAPELAIRAAGSRLAGPAGLPEWTDLELAWRVRDKTRGTAEWLCVAGAEADRIAGLAALMLVAAGIRAAPAGGEGVPAIDAVRDPTGFDVLVVAATVDDLGGPSRRAPLATACVGDGAGLGAVHADARLACVYRSDDAATVRLVEDAEVQEGCRAIGVTLGVPGPSELGIVDDLLVDRAFLADRRTSALELATLDDASVAGLDTARDLVAVLAAAALARSAGAPPAAVREAVRAWPTRL